MVPLEMVVFAIHPLFEETRMRKFDEAATATFFNQAFAPMEKAATEAPELKLRHRDKIFLQSLLQPLNDRSVKILDFGCGQGRLLSHLVMSGYDAVGMEKHAGMLSHAAEALRSIGAPERVSPGGIAELAKLEPHSFDIVVMMGVMQYLSEADYALALSSIKRILRPRGFLVATFQNALFDLFTFNKYTLDFMTEQLLEGLVDDAEKQEVWKRFNSLIMWPQEPHYSATRARDNVFVRLSNPLTIAQELGRHGLHLQTTYFYEWFGLPPLIKAAAPEIAKRIADTFELINPTDWRGNFMANAFLAHIDLNFPNPGPCI
jgi:SAM-dependent methyltransferase